MSQLGLFPLDVPPPQPVATDRLRPPKRAVQARVVVSEMLPLPPERPEPIETAEAIARYSALIEKHHASMLAGDVEIVAALRKDAYGIAERMNGDGKHFGIKSAPDAPCYVLERATASPAGTVPLWGQTGEFIIDVAGTRVRIVMEGLFGIGGFGMFWLGFSANAVDWDKPFISSTGYRSFVGIMAETREGMTPDTFTAAVVRSHMGQKNRRGKPENKLVYIDKDYAERAQARAKGR